MLVERNLSNYLKFTDHVGKYGIAIIFLKISHDIMGIFREIKISPVDTYV